MTITEYLDEAVALFDQASAAREDRRLTDAVAGYRRALEIFEAHAGTQADVANVLVGLGASLCALGDHGEAERVQRRALVVLAGLGDQPVEIQAVLDRIRVQALLGLTTTLRDRGRYGEAEAVGLTATALAGWAIGPDDADTAAAHNGLGVVYRFAGRFDEAERHYRRALAATGLDVLLRATIHHNLAGLAHARGRSAEGESDGRRSVRLRASVLGADHPDVVADEANLAALLHELGQLDEAEALLRRAVAIFERWYGPGHLDVAVNLHNLAAVRQARGDLAEAESLYLRALEIKRAALGPHHSEVALTAHNLAALLAETGRPEQAYDLARQAQAIFLATVDPSHPGVTASSELLALVAAGRE